MNPIRCFFKKYFDGLQNKILYNFNITNPNGMNQIIICRKNYNLWEANFLKFYLSFCRIVQYPLSSIQGLLGYNFCFQTPIEIKIIFLER